MAKITAILGVGDWADASVDHLVLPEGMDIEAEYTAYRDWRKAGAKLGLTSFAQWQRYLEEQSGLKAGAKPEDVSFVQWLQQRGARKPSEDELTEFVET